ncbi:MAG: hypothetical protein CMJ39_10965 [Phycisphaerae bacterium]|nr:hypothetical protein [Phycisphaerae bacterium]
MIDLKPRSRWSPPLRASILVLLACFITWPATAEASDDPRFDIAIRHLKRAVTPQRDESHLARLSSLRIMKDPEMERLFLRLLNHDAWQIQVHAVLGLAEISEDGNVMPWLVTQVRPEARSQILAIAMEQNRLDAKTIKELTDWKDLEEANRVALFAHSQSHDGNVSLQEVNQLTQAKDEKVAAAAWLLMTWLGDASGPAKINAMLKELPETKQLDILLTLTMMIRRHEISQAYPWLDQTISELRQSERFPAAVTAGTGTLLALDPERGIRHWRKNFGEQPNRRRQIDAALMLLHAGTSLPDMDQERIDVGDELVGSIVAAGNAVAENRGDAPQRLIELAELDHVRSTTLLPGVIETLPEDQAKVVLDRFLDNLESDSFTEMDRVLAIEATYRLLELDPEFLLKRLRNTPDDSPLQEVMLNGMLRYRTPGILDAVSGIRRIGMSTTDALALMLLARESQQLEDAEVRQLGLLASGGSLSNQLQAQAAWLYLKHTDRLENAMIHLVPERP